jgi:anti-sigma regulatory factor (Ser/Thr protein kinase)
VTLFAGPPGSRVVEELALDDRAPRQAREAARRWLAGDVRLQLVEDLVLLVSELVANAVQSAAAGPIRLTLSRHADVVRCEVANLGSAVPTHQIVAPDAPSGRGLHIVDRLAARWGTAGMDGTTTVWFELDGQRGGSQTNGSPR